MPEVVDRQRHLIADDLSDLFHIVFEKVKSLFGQMNAGEGVGGGDDVIAFLRAHHVRCDRAALHIEDVRGIGLHVVDEAERGVDRARLVKKQPDAEIHFEERKAHVHALFERKPHVVSRMFAVHVGVAIDPHAVAEFAAEQLIERHTVCLAREIPQGDLDAGHTAALTGRTAELLYLAKNFVHIAGVFAENAAFEHQGIGLAGSIAHLVEAGDALVCVDAQDGAALGRAIDVHKAHVRDAQIGRGRTDIHDDFLS